jgi:TRAP transporter TAXI family solute receptor
MKTCRVTALFAVFFFSIFVVRPAQAETVTIGTCGTGGYWFQSGTVLAELINEHAEGDVNAKAIPTQCAAANLVALAKGEIDFGLSVDSMDRKAFNGEDAFSDKGTKGKLRSVTTWYTNYLHIYTLDPDIKTLDDLRGKRVAIGAPKGGSFKQANAVLKAAGMEPGEDVELAKVNLESGIRQLKGGQVDAQFWLMPTNNPAMSELTNTRDVYFIPVSSAIVEKIPAGLNVRLETLSPEVYPMLEEGLPALASSATMTTREDVDDKVVEQLLDAVYGHLDAFYGALPATAREVKPENALSGLVIPLHDGAENYYEKHDFPGLESFKERVK